MSCAKRYKEVFYKKGVLRNFPKFTGKHLCQSLFFNKVLGLYTSWKHQKTRATFFTEQLRWLLLLLTSILYQPYPRELYQPGFTCSKSTMEIPEQCIRSLSSSYFEQISHIVLVFLLLTSKKQMRERFGNLKRGWSTCQSVWL